MLGIFRLLSRVSRAHHKRRSTRNRINNRRINISRDINRRIEKDLNYYRLTRDDTPIARSKRRLADNDRRRYNPTKSIYNRDLYDRLVRLQVSRPTKFEVKRDALPNRISFNDSHNVPVCRRRHQRRASLFAYKRIGSGHRGNRRVHRWTDDSKISCKE